MGTGRPSHCLSHVCTYVHTGLTGKQCKVQMTGGFHFLLSWLLLLCGRGLGRGLRLRSHKAKSCPNITPLSQQLLPSKGLKQG